MKATLLHLCNNQFKQLITDLDSNNNTNGITSNVAVAHDTRPSCAHLLAAFKSGADALKSNLVNYGLLTTPQLHYIVRCLNTSGKYGNPSEAGYYTKISQAFYNVWSLVSLI